MKGNYGAMRTNDPDTDEYYTVEWYYNVHTAQDDILMKEYNLLEYAYAGEMVCKGMFWNLVIKSKYSIHQYQKRKVTQH